MCMLTDKVAETIRGNVLAETAEGKHRVTPQIVFNLNFFMPGHGPSGNANGMGTAGTLLTQGCSSMMTQGSSNIGV